MVKHRAYKLAIPELGMAGKKFLPCGSTTSYDVYDPHVSIYKIAK